MNGYRFHSLFYMELKFRFFVSSFSLVNSVLCTNRRTRNRLYSDSWGQIWSLSFRFQRKNVSHNSYQHWKTWNRRPTCPIAIVDPSTLMDDSSNHEDLSLAICWVHDVARNILQGFLSRSTPGNIQLFWPLFMQSKTINESHLFMTIFCFAINDRRKGCFPDMRRSMKLAPILLWIMNPRHTNRFQLWKLGFILRYSINIFTGGRRVFIPIVVAASHCSGS